MLLLHKPHLELKRMLSSNCLIQSDQFPELPKLGLELQEILRTRPRDVAMLWMTMQQHWAWGNTEARHVFQGGRDSHEDTLGDPGHKHFF